MSERKRGSSPSPMAVKTYVVLQRLNLTRQDEVNSTIIAVRLTKAAAEEIRDANPGTWVEKHVAIK